MATKRDFTQAAHDVYMRATGQAVPNTGASKDFTQQALDLVRQATGEVTTPAPRKKPESGRKASAKKAEKVKP